ncbi:MAG TPA: hypothetical protein VMV10_08630, partial [Pirellulales bacterium]|nr:hypothetical protein [Pirellulales bacterium]
AAAAKQGEFALGSSPDAMNRAWLAKARGQRLLKRHSAEGRVSERYVPSPDGILVGQAFQPDGVAARD